MIDFHCHLDLYEDAVKLLPIVAAKNIFTLVNTTSPRAWQKTSLVFSNYSNIKVALGLHPEIVDKKAQERELMMSSIAKAQFIGEVGIDGSNKYKATISLQESIFNEILVEAERQNGKIISIHSRYAVSKVLDAIERKCNRNTIVLHWFTGDKYEARRAVSLGCWFSVGPAMLNRNNEMLLYELPIDRILPETDGPFATINNRTLMPWESINIGLTLAPLWKVSYDDFCNQMKRNLALIISR